MRLAVNDQPLVLLDVDGVLNLARFRSSKERSRLIRHEGYFHRKPRDPFSDDRLLVNLRAVRPLVQELAGSGAELAWATTWGQGANDVLVPLLGLPSVLPAAPVNFDLSAKAYTVIPWAQGRPWAWLDDQEHELAVASALSRQPHCPVLVDRATGLTRGNVNVILNWLEEL